jgi:SNF2 family DNA or RNA helicase
MRFNPLPHQHLAIDHLKNTEEALLFAGMGLGKTAAVLSALDYLFADGDVKGLLVVAPLRVSVLTWPDEGEQWANFRYMKISNLRTKQGKKDWENGAAHIYTINYESMPRFVNEYIKGRRASELPVDVVLFDEIDNAKNPSSKRIKTFRQYARPKFRRAWGMTGTPVSNSRLDLFAQVRLIDQGKAFGTKYTPWERRFFEPENYHSQYPKMILRPGSEGELERLTAHMALVLRSEDWLKIPPVHTKDVAVTLPKEAKRIYKQVETELLETLEDGAEILAVNQAVLVTKLLQITSGAVYVQEGEDEATRRPETIHTAKIDALRKLHNGMDQEPLLVSTQYKHEVDRILEAFPYARKFENHLLKDWNAGKIKMLVSHPKSIGHGLNLQHGGRAVCWFSLGYSRGLYDQFNARIARQGQDQETTIYRLLVSGSIDDAVAGALHGKGEDQQAFLKTLQNIKRLVAK